MNEAGIHLRLDVPGSGTFHEPHQRFVGTASVDLELCAVVVSGSAVGVEFECSLQGRFGLCHEGRVLVLGEHAIEAPTLGPRRGKPRIDSEALIEQIAGPAPRRGFHPELHPTHVQIESLGTRGAEPRTAPNIISGQRQRLDDALRQLVVQLEDRVHVDLQRMGPEHVPGRRAHQLRADPQPVVRSQDRACQHDIYREFSRRGSEVGDSGRILGRAEARPHHERFQPRQCISDHVGEAQAQVLDLGIGSEQAKGQHRQPRHGPGFRYRPVIK